jgi:hypothetical protein
MKKIIFEVSDDMFIAVDKAVIQEGFMSRSEFLRFLIAVYFKEKNVQAENAGAEKPANEEELDLEYGVPANVIRKIEEVAKTMGENERQQRS